MVGLWVVLGAAGLLLVGGIVDGCISRQKYDLGPRKESS